MIVLVDDLPDVPAIESARPTHVQKSLTAYIAHGCCGNPSYLKLENKSRTMCGGNDIAILVTSSAQPELELLDVSPGFVGI